MSKSLADVRFESNVTAFTRAIRQIGITAEMAANNIAAAFGLVRKTLKPMADATLAWERRMRGGNGSDAIRWPDMWQSATCSAWLHDSCPSDCHSLGCTCTCHGKDKP